MAGKITGRFYLKRTSNGNLTGEWSNNHGGRAFSESADLTKSSGGGFLGIYASTWQEDGKPCFATLTIKKKGSGPLFAVEWSGPASFAGEGMLCDDILIGDYYSTH